jgi:hypothetical protein
MKAAIILVLLLACALAVPSFGQQKIYNWIPGNDETVRLDPNFYHASPPYQPGHGARSMHVDIDAQQPVTLAVVSVRDWNDASQRPESMGSLTLFCVQEHVLQTTYSCDVPLGTPTLLVVRDERGERGMYAGRGEITGGRDYDKRPASAQPSQVQPSQAPPVRTDRPPSGGADRNRDGRDVGQYIAGAADAWLGGRARRQFSYPNDVHIQYYDWACTDNCNLPDPPRPKLFDWVPADTVVNRLDPGEFFHGHTIDFGSRDNVYHFDLEAQWPVTIAVVSSRDWAWALAGQFGKNLDNIDYYCLQQHVVKTTFTCKIDYANDSLFMVIWDERTPLPPDQYTQAPAGYTQTQAGQQGLVLNSTQPIQPAPQATARPATTATGQSMELKLRQPATLASGQKPAPAERVSSEVTSASSQSTTPASSGAAMLYRSRPFMAPNEIRRLGYVWRCVDACDQPDYNWASQVNESYTLNSGARYYGGAVIPDHNGEQVSIHVKSPVPLAVTMLRAKAAFRIYNQPDLFESVVENSPCIQRGVQESTFQCTINLADGPQSIVLKPEDGSDIPERKKAEVLVQAFKCVDNCAGPSFGWVEEKHEKYHPTSILKTYGSFLADHDGEQVSIRIKSPVPMVAALLPTRQANQLYGRPQSFDEEMQKSSCQQHNMQDAALQCTIDIADGPLSVVVRPETGYSLPRDKKTEVQIQTMKCVDKCDSQGK